MAKQTKLKQNLIKEINQLTKKAINRLMVETKMEDLYALPMHNYRSYGLIQRVVSTAA